MKSAQFAFLFATIAVMDELPAPAPFPALAGNYGHQSTLNVKWPVMFQGFFS